MGMLNYGIGGKVKVKMDLVVNTQYGSDTFVGGMRKYIGGRATITDIRGDRYALDIDGGKWNWTDEMLIAETVGYAIPNHEDFVTTHEDQTTGQTDLSSSEDVANNTKQKQKKKKKDKA